MSISLNDINFDGPYPITYLDPHYRAAVYTIMCKDDPANKPNEYTLIYVGESGDLSERGFYRSHQKYECWIKYAGSVQNLYIGIHLMPDSTPADRRQIESDLITHLSPDCNLGN